MEGALAEYATHLVTDPDVAEAFDGWVKRSAPAVRAAILGTKLVQLTLPGVADVYQGTESASIALVDPDNRRPGRCRRARRPAGPARRRRLTERLGR